jgi:hypothetical protein
MIICPPRWQPIKELGERAINKERARFETATAAARFATNNLQCVIRRYQSVETAHHTPVEVGDQAQLRRTSRQRPKMMGNQF